MRNLCVCVCGTWKREKTLAFHLGRVARFAARESRDEPLFSQLGAHPVCVPCACARLRVGLLCAFPAAERGTPCLRAESQVEKEIEVRLRAKSRQVANQASDSMREVRQKLPPVLARPESVSFRLWDSDRLTRDAARNANPRKSPPAKSHRDATSVCA